MRTRTRARARLPINSELANRLRQTAPGRKILSSLQLAGTGEEILGGKFWQKAKKGLSKVGKKTGAITGRIAKVAAGLVGIPPGAIDALAKLDPTASKRLKDRIAASPAAAKAEEIVTGKDTKLANIFSNLKPAQIAALGVAGIGIIFLITRKK